MRISGREYDDFVCGVVVTGVIVVTVGWCAPTWLDEGSMRTPDGDEICPVTIPVWLRSDGTLDRSSIEAACAWWNDEIGETVCDIAVDGTWDNDIIVGTADLGMKGGRVLGRLDATIEGKYLIPKSIKISTSILHDNQKVMIVMRHEIGHALGLLDDPGPPETVDLRSIMGRNLQREGTLTDGDLAHVLRCMEDYHD